MRIKVIMPIEADEESRQRREDLYTQYVTASTRVDVVSPANGPAQLQTHEDVLASELETYREGMKSKTDEYEAIMVDSIFDPAVQAIQEITNIPTFGPLKCTLHISQLLAAEFSILAHTNSIAVFSILRTKIENYGLASRLVSLRALDVPPRMSQHEVKLVPALEKQLKAFVQDGAPLVVIGCTFLPLPADFLSKSEIPLVFPAEVTLRLIEQFHFAGLLREFEKRRQ